MSLSQTGWHFGIILVNSYCPFLFNAGHVTPIGIKKDGELTNGWEPESSALLPTGLVGSWQKWRSGPLPELIIQLNWFPHLYTWFSPFIDHSAKTFLLDTQIKPCISPVWTSVFDTVVTVIYGEYCWNLRILLLVLS